MQEEVVKFNEILNAFKIKATCNLFRREGSSSSYWLSLDPCVKLKSLTKYSDELALALKSSSSPLFQCDFNSGSVRVDFVSKNFESNSLNTSIHSATAPVGMKIPILLGKDYYGKNVWMDLEENPHMIVAGTTGSGKTIALHTIIGNIIYNEKCRLSLVDPKGFEFSKYSSCNNTKVYSSYEEVSQLLEEAIEEMEFKFSLMRDGFCKDIISPHIILIDEYSDLIMQDRNKKLYRSLCTLAQKCRAAKIHIILATQRPSSSLLDGNIKANFPARLACKVTSKIDSKIIIDSPGAEELLGKGDSILINSSNNKTKLKIAYSTAEDNIKNANSKNKKINQ